MKYYYNYYFRTIIIFNYLELKKVMIEKKATKIKKALKVKKVIRVMRWLILILMAENFVKRFKTNNGDIKIWHFRDNISLKCNVVFPFYFLYAVNNLEMIGIPSGKKLIKTIRYPHMWRHDIFTCEDIDDFTAIEFVS